ncbi:hypothetical protein B0T25DRAFT_529761 [Lasiosphaeria hispida]|uniref:Uncharacterized protein n=1 Tax=Lasiosphaeria hispida TaxID=260671 RepID=A0AAJ0MKZ0_9PEZI|nr:hypothetical protein B0T25DRAFT_529761 [Lasiosphaeria hispida]
MSSLTKFLTRPRASTRAILGAQYDEAVDTDPQPPAPLASIDQYDEARLKEGLLYADRTLRIKHRVVSPMAAHLLGLYKATVKSAIEKEWADDNERVTLLKTLFVYERELYINNALRLPSKHVDTSIMDRLLELRRYEFAARYGDYVGEVCKKLKVKAKEQSTLFFHQLHGWDRYWTDIAREIQNEASDWDKWESGDETVKESIKTRLAVYNACNYIGLNFDETRQTIMLYGDRNSILHTSVLRLVEKGMWHKLSGLLHDDLRDLPIVTPLRFKSSIPILQHIIECVIDRYYQRDPSAPHNYNRWTPKEESYRRAAELTESREQRAKRAAEEKARVQEAAIKRFKQMVKDYSYAHLAAHVAGTPIPAGASSSSTIIKRRVRPDERDAREKGRKKQRIAWEGLVKVQKHAHRQVREYTETYGTSEPPLDPEVYLDDELVGEILDSSSSPCEDTPCGPTAPKEDGDSKDDRTHGPEVDMGEEKMVGLEVDPEA